MRKIAKSLTAIVLVAIMCMTSITTAFAAETSPSPRLSHASNGSFTFAATENGGHVDCTYYGYDSFVRADITITVEKRFLLAFWSDIGEWSASSTVIDGEFYHTFPLDGSGTYRANFTLIITGNDGTTDVITDTIKSKY